MDTIFTHFLTVEFIAIFSMIVMLIHVHTTNVLEQKSKKGFVILYSLNILLCLIELFSIFLYKYFIGLPLTILFTAETILIPLIPIVWVKAAFVHKRVNWIHPVLIMNAIIQIINIYTHFLFYITDEGKLVSGQFFWINYIFYILSIIAILEEFMYNSRFFQKQGRVSMIFILIFLTSGVLAQIIFQFGATIGLTFSIAAIMLTINFSDSALQIDALTGLLNRRCYEKFLEDIKYSTSVIMFDVDDFKMINDTYGHQFGDYCLKVIGEAIIIAYGKHCLCYRIGGDEFCVIFKRGQFNNKEELDEQTITDSISNEQFKMKFAPKEMQQLNLTFNQLMEKERLNEPRLPDITLGYDFFTGLESIDQIISRADKIMYKKKRERKTKKFENAEKNVIAKSKKEISVKKIDPTYEDAKKIQEESKPKTKRTKKSEN